TGRKPSAAVRTGEHRDPFRREGFGPDLAHPPAVVREALRCGEQPVACAQQRLDPIAQLADAATRRRHDEVIRGERPLEIGGHLYSDGHAYAGEVFAILASRRDLLGLRGVSGPEDHVLATV